MKTNATMKTLAGTLLALMVMTASSEAAMSKKVVDQARRDPPELSTHRTPNAWFFKPGLNL